MHSASSSHANPRSRKVNRRVWSKVEEDTLLNIIDDAVAKGYRTENGTFKPGTYNYIEKSLANLCPGCELKATPHIESKMKKWKKDYGIVFDMLNKSGFGWNDTKKCIEVDSDDVWADYVQINKDADGWRDKPFPLYERLANIFGLDRATGLNVETPADMAADPTDTGEDEEDSPMSVSQNSQSRPTTRRKRNKPSDAVGSGLERIAESLDKMMGESREQWDQLANSICPKLTPEQLEFLRAELRRLGMSVTDRIKAINICSEKIYKFHTFIGLDDEEKLIFIRDMLGGSSTSS